MDVHLGFHPHHPSFEGGGGHPGFPTFWQIKVRNAWSVSKGLGIFLQSLAEEFQTAPKPEHKY